MPDAKILIVEDEAIEAMDIQQRLVSLGYPLPDIAYNGEEGVRKAEQTQPDLILMDIMMPGKLDGVAAAAQIRSRYDIPVIFLTAYADDNTLRRAKITAPYGYIVKPFQERELHITVDMALYRHKMERELHEREKWLATTLRSIGDAVIATDEKGLVTFMNPVAEALLGCKLEEVVHGNLTEVFNIVNRDTRKPVENPVTRVIREGNIAGLANHTVLISRDGREIPINDSAAPIKDDLGNVLGVILIFSDMTEREKAAESLRESQRENEFLAGLIRASSQPVAIGYPDGRLGLFNRAFEELTGYAADELRSINWATALTPLEWLEMERDKLTELHRTGQSVRYEKEYIRKDGTRFPVELLVHLVSDSEGKPQYYYAFLTDLTERKQAEEKVLKLNEELKRNVAELSVANASLRDSRRATLNMMEDALAARKRAEVANAKLLQEATERQKAEQALLERERLLQDVIDGSTSPIFLKDRDGKFITINASLERMLGMSREEIKGKTDYDIAPREVADYWRTHDKKVMATGKAIQIEEVADLQDGHHIFLANKFPLVDTDGQTYGVGAISHDITERKRAEEVLRESEERFRALTMASSDVVYRMSPDWSEMRQLRGRGFIADTENPNRNWLQEYIHPDDQAHVKAVIDEAIRTKSIFELEHRVLRVDGTLGWTFSLAIPLLDKSEIVEWLGAASDITERKIAEETLRQLNRTLQALSRSDRALLYATEETEYLQEICRIIVENCGYAMVWVGFAEHDEAKSVRPAASAGFEAGYLDTLQLTWADTERGRGPTGTAIRTGRVAMCRNMQTDPQFGPWRAEAIKRGYGSSAVFPLLTDGRAFGALTIYSREPEGFGDDEVKLLTELSADFAYGITTLRLRAKHAAIEAALRESEERYRSLFENMLHGFAYCKMLYDEGGRPLDFIYLDVNRAFEKLTGLKNVVGKRVTDVIPGIREAHPELFDIYGRVASTGRPENVEIEFKPLGLWLSISIYSNVREHFVAIFDDISERKKAETDIMQLSEDLAIRNMSLESVNKELESFIYSVSHDLRAPIRTMSGFAKIINEDYAGKLDAQGQDYLNRILKGSEKSTQLINDLLRLSMISRQGLDKIDVNLSNKVSKVVDELRQTNQGRNVEVVVQGGLTASADPTLIELALSNLLGNAWKFTSETGKPRIEFGSVVKNEKTVYYVKDNGAGFDMTYADKMFLPFHRLHTEKEFEGTGIGLTIVERIIRRHGGKVWAEGEVGKGATFFFTL